MLEDEGKTCRARAVTCDCELRHKYAPLATPIVAFVAGTAAAFAGILGCDLDRRVHLVDSEGGESPDQTFAHVFDLVRESSIGVASLPKPGLGDAARWVNRAALSPAAAAASASAVAAAVAARAELEVAVSKTSRKNA